MPTHLVGWPGAEGNLEKHKPAEAWERAPSYLVQAGECPCLDAHALQELTQASGRARAQERTVRIAELKAKYPDFWGKRGTAKVIASLETADGNPLMERTVRKYFRDG
ncbi:hypothetical protein [Neoroseomonas soli]|uniref:Uncharacterized protein n=1 Tax=Neoroseomonas soli TaxID=1081025 RepID=A0A9X9WX46_9PROT|nr:hypothetical protein [Neoroseomonas soli]MBR0671725.1 hypothetical protein [Neoroseomonas soli]